jgi:hypothetical protein
LGTANVSGMKFRISQASLHIDRYVANSSNRKCAQKPTRECIPQNSAFPLRHIVETNWNISSNTLSDNTRDQVCRSSGELNSFLNRGIRLISSRDWLSTRIFARYHAASESQSRESEHPEFAVHVKVQISQLFGSLHAPQVAFFLLLIPLLWQITAR